MTGRALEADLTVTGLRETLRAFNTYGRDANRELRQAAGGIADTLVPALVLAAAMASPQATLAAASVKRRSDRVPVIVAGGSRRVRPSTRPGRRVTAGDVFFGAEFGGGRRPSTRQFPPWVGTAGYWFWPTVRAHLPRLRREYIRTLDELAARWAQGGDEPGG
ncbi:MAG TPA: hypothetical protein VJM49_13605 [Acidimicrobiales bacterium]|nr:hypothetical protein [Acidimicrobiales bacterium]